MKSYGVTIQMKSLSHGIVYFLCSSNFWVCWWSPTLLTFKWNLSGRHFKWYFLFLRINFSKKKFKLFCDFFSLVTYWSGSVNTSLTVTVRQKCRLQGTWKKKKMNILVTYIVWGEDCFWFRLKLECSRILRSCLFHGNPTCFLIDRWDENLSISLFTRAKENKPITVEPCLTTTPFMRPPRYYDHNFLAQQSNFIILKTKLMWPPRYYDQEFYGPTVVAL